MRGALLVVALVVAACPAGAQEISFLGGTMHDTKTHDHSYAWSLEYKEGLDEHVAFSFSYLNEGHVPDHHRDGGTVQLWLRSHVFDRRLSLAVGAGPYYYFDTARVKPGDFYVNNHGWGGMTSLAGTWYTESRWFLQLRADRTATRGMDSLSAVFGVGYRLDSPTSPGPPVRERPQRGKTTENEITALLGVTIVNSFGSEHSVATGIEYRRGLRRYVDWTFSWFYEGDNSRIQRNGLLTQLWAVKPFFRDRLTLGVGGGVYHAVDRDREPQQEKAGDRFFAGAVTLTGSYRFHPHWGMRVSFNRIVTNYSRDTDVIMGGIGYRF